MKINSKTPLFFIFVLGFATLTQFCNFIPASVPGSSITGKDVKSELKKVRQDLFTTSFFGLSAASGASFAARSSIKTCPGYTTVETAPVFTLPSPSLYTNVNLVGSVTSAIPQFWQSTSITETSTISVVKTNTSVSCTTSLGTVATSNSLSFQTITVSSVPTTLSIRCSTTSTSTQSYTLSLNPRASGAVASPFSQFTGSVDSLVPDQLFSSIAKIDDDTVYTYDSFRKCKSSYQQVAYAYTLQNSNLAVQLEMCGNYTPSPAQTAVQAFSCNLDKASLVEL